MASIGARVWVSVAVAIATTVAGSRAWAECGPDQAVAAAGCTDQYLRDRSPPSGVAEEQPAPGPVVAPAAPAGVPPANVPANAAAGPAASPTAPSGERPAAQSATAPTTSSGRSEDDESGLSDEAKGCKDAASEASFACRDLQMFAGLAQSTGAAFTGSPQNIQQACEKAKKIQDMSALINGLGATACATMTALCMATCPSDPPAPAAAQAGGTGAAPRVDAAISTSAIKRHRNRCRGLSIYAVRLTAQAAAMAGAASASGKCQNIATAAPPPVIAPPPIIPGGNGLGPSLTDCSGANGSSPFCQNCLANPSAPNCQASTLNPNFTGGSGNPAAGGPAYQSGIAENPNTEPNVRPTDGRPGRGNEIANNAGPGPSGMNGGGGGGGRAGGGNGEDQRAPAGNGFNTNVMSGMTPGSGFGGFVRKPAGGGGGGGMGNLWDKMKGKFGLDKGLLPDRSQYGNARREISSANGPTIWEKVSRQYQVQSPEFIP